MSTALAKTSPPKPTDDLPPWLTSAVSTMTKDYPPKIPAGTALTTTQRSEVTATMDCLSACLAPGKRREIGAAVTELLSLYPADGASEAMEVARAKQWVEALEDLPAWAIDEARKRWNRGEVEGVNSDFAPKPPRFRQIVLDVMTPVRAKRDRLTLLLRAEPMEPELPPEHRERMQARWAAFLDELKRPCTPEAA